MRKLLATIIQAATVLTIFSVQTYAQNFSIEPKPETSKEIPHKITIDYVKTVSKFGGLVEVRSGQFTQDLPVFVRMIDKDSGWTMNNGLPTLITTLLQVLIISIIS